MEIKLGQLIDGDAQRDAVHIAIAPAIATERLLPGQRITVVKGYAYPKIYDAIGIVDPFLRKPVERGMKFYVCVNPGTITSIHHNWTHPVFDPLGDPLPIGKEAHDVR